MKTLDWILRLVALVAVILAVVILPRSCGISEKYYALQAEHDALLNDFVNYKLHSADEIAKYEADKRERDVEIAAANAEISRKRAQLAARDADIAALEDQYATLTDCPAQVANLQAQVAAWRDKFTVAEGIIADKDAVIFSLTEKYNDQLIITSEYQGLAQRTQRLYEVQVQMNEELRKSVNASKRLGAAKNVAVIAAAAIVGYLVLK